MSFWDSLKSSVNNAVNSAQVSYNNAISYPTEMQCTWRDCLVMNNIPVDTYAWTCINGHANSPIDSKCNSCTSTKSDSKAAGLYRAQIQCTGCQRILECSETNIATNFWTSLYTAPMVAENAISSAKSTVKELSSAPTTFTCEHCKIELYTPTGPWVCTFENCNQSNVDGSFNCSACSSSRYISGVICSVCKRTSAVPETAFGSKVDSLVASTQKMTVNSFKYIDGSVTAPCGTCKFPIQLDREQVRAILGLDPDAPVPGFDEVAHKTDPLSKLTNYLNKVTTTHTSEEQQPLTSNQTQEELDMANALGDMPAQDNSAEAAQKAIIAPNPQPQDVLCTKCLHMTTVTAETLYSRKIEAPQHQQQPLQQPHPDRIIIRHVDDNGNPITCCHCNQKSNYLHAVMPCYTCKKNYCRRCGPYSREVMGIQQPFCYVCAVQYDKDNNIHSATVATHNNPVQQHPTAPPQQPLQQPQEQQDVASPQQNASAASFESNIPLEDQYHALQ